MMCFFKIDSLWQASGWTYVIFRAFELLGGGFKYFYVHPYLGKINIFQMGWNHQPEISFSLDTSGLLT